LVRTFFQCSILHLACVICALDLELLLHAKGILQIQKLFRRHGFIPPKFFSRRIAIVEKRRGPLSQLVSANIALLYHKRKARGGIIGHFRLSPRRGEAKGR
jgi:hypothetical protein